MNRRKLSVVLSALGTALIVALFCAGLNLDEGVSNVDSRVLFSSPSGFYDEPFYLELTGRGKIYYTLDCSAPDENSLPYTGPILIEDAGKNENVYSMIPDVCFEFNQALTVELYEDKRMGYRLPSEKTDKATIVRAVSIGEDGSRGKEVTGVYFVGYDGKPAYHDMMVLSISTDPENLFDPNTGIYVTGHRASRMTLETIKNKNSYRFWNANYRQRGRNWEREVYACLFDSQRNLLFSGSYGLRIQGGASRALLPKSLNLFARSEYGDSINAQRIFGDGYQLGSLNLNSGANGVSTKLHDYLVNSLAADLDVETRPYVPCAVFLEGEYWGVYWLTPRYEAEFFQSRHGIYGQDVIEVKVNRIEIGNEEDEEYKNALFECIAGGDMSLPEDYGRACEMIDIQSFLDYYAMELYIANVDWPANNVAYWRTRKPYETAVGDTRWRWIVYDVNYAMLLADAEKNRIEMCIKQDELFAGMMENKGFRESLYDRLVYLAREVFSPEKVNALIDDYEVWMADAIVNEYARFYDSERTEEDFITDCENIRAFFEKRHDYIINTFSGEARDSL